MAQPNLVEKSTNTLQAKFALEGAGLCRSHGGLLRTVIHLGRLDPLILRHHSEKKTSGLRAVRLLGRDVLRPQPLNPPPTVATMRV